MLFTVINLKSTYQAKSIQKHRKARLTFYVFVLGMPWGLIKPLKSLELFRGLILIKTFKVYEVFILFRLQLK